MLTLRPSLECDIVLDLQMCGSYSINSFCKKTSTTSCRSKPWKTGQCMCRLNMKFVCLNAQKTGFKTQPQADVAISSGEKMPGNWATACLYNGMEEFWANPPQVQPALRLAKVVASLSITCDLDASWHGIGHRFDPDQATN